MKKYLLLFLTLCLLFTGCSSNKRLSIDDFEFSKDQVTKTGICIGTTSDEFKSVYEFYKDNVGVTYIDDEGNLSDLKQLTIDSVDYTKHCLVGIYTMFVDNKSMNAQKFQKKHKIKSGHENWVKWARDNKEYLNKHTVVYKEIIFTFEDGKVNNIQENDTDYNKISDGIEEE